MESWFRPWRGDKSRALLGLGPGEETSPGLGFEYVMGGSQGTGLGPITGISSTGHVWAQPGCQGFGLASPSVLLIDNMPSQILQVFLVNIIM